MRHRRQQVIVLFDAVSAFIVVGLVWWQGRELPLDIKLPSDDVPSFWSA